MKNVLIITYNFPPRPAVGGLRLYGLAKYLPQYGWKPIILTAILPGDPDPQCTVIQTPYDDVVAQWKKRLGLNPNQAVTEQFNISTKQMRFSIIDRIALISSEIIAYPDGNRGWYNHAVLAGEEIVKREKIDAIISSSSPVTSHLIAKFLSEKYQIPWIADLRDLWTQNHYFQHSRIRRFFERKLEMNTLGSANALTTVSLPWEIRLHTLHPTKKVTTITNGFDHVTITDSSILDEKFSITYTGSIYTNKQDPELLLVAITELYLEGKINLDDVIIKFFGHTNRHLLNLINKYHLEKVVATLDFVDRERILKEQNKAQILLLLSWNDPNEKGVIPAKIFEYLAAERPILSIGKYGGGEVEKILNDTHAGKDLTDLKEIKIELLNSYTEFKKCGSVTYKGLRESILKYSHLEMAKKFSDVLNSII